jgi:hypothetical protein
MPPIRWNGAVAQLGERVVRNDEVRSSILLSSTSGFWRTCLAFGPMRTRWSGSPRASQQALRQPDIFRALGTAVNARPLDRPPAARASMSSHGHPALVLVGQIKAALERADLARIIGPGRQFRCPSRLFSPCFCRSAISRKRASRGVDSTGMRLYQFWSNK